MKTTDSGFIADYLAYTSPQESTQRMRRWVAISVIAAALERKVWLPRGHYTLFPNLYTFIVAPSGFKKSTTTAVGVSLLRELEGISTLSDRMTASALISQLAKSTTEFALENGVRIKQSSLFAYSSELHTFLAEVFGSIVELLTTFYDCVPHDPTKAWIYETKGEGTTKIYGPCLNLLSATTPVWLARVVPPAEMEGGFSSRVIYVVERGQPEKFVAWPDAGDDAEQIRRKALYDSLVTAIKRIYSHTGPFRTTPALRAFGQIWYEDHQKKIVGNSDLRFSGYYARKFDTVLKVAMAIAVSDGAFPVLDVPHFQRALDLLEDIEVNMFEAFGSYGENANAPLVDRAWSYIATAPRGQITHSELLRHMRRDADHGRLTALLEDLRRMHRVVVQVDPSQRVVTYHAVDPERPL